MSVLPSLVAATPVVDIDGTLWVQGGLFLAMVFVHNQPSVTLFEAHGFQRWGLLPRVFEVDGIERDVLILGRRV